LETIGSYFPNLSASILDRLASLYELYTYWNARVNVISRKDMDHFYIHHVLHSLSLMKVIRFEPGTRILDAGTGGGFPGIPLSVCFPECDFLLADSIGKKIKVVQAVADTLKLQNVRAKQARVEALTEQFDFVVSRAVTALPVFWKWTADRILPGGRNAIPNGVLYLKGGEFIAELKGLNAQYVIYDLSEFFNIDYLMTKKVVHLFDRSSKKIFDKGKIG